MCSCSCWFLTTPERSSGWRSEMRPCVLGMWWGGGGTDRTGLQTDIFKSWFYEPNSCISLYQKSTKVLHGDICSLWLAETFWKKKKKSAWLHGLSLHQNHMDTEPLTCLFGAVSQLSEVLSPWLHFSFCLQRNVHLSRCVIFLSYHHPIKEYRTEAVGGSWWVIHILSIIWTSMLRCFHHVQLFGTLWTVAHQTPLSTGFSRQD